MKKQLKAGVPWFFKIPAKLALARIPFSYRVWKRIGIFDNGPMQHSDYVHRVFKTHFGAGSLRPGFSCVELGPGDSLMSALFARAHGAGSIYLVDAQDFAAKDVAFYRDVAEQLAAAGFDVPTSFNSIPDMLQACGAEYLTQGLRSLMTLPSGSVDFIWSQAVLEHVWKDEFVPMVSTWRRLLRDDGFASHTVDLKDHFNNALNNLRFSDRVWESRAFRTSGFYTNRIRFGEMQSIFKEAGFEPVVTVRKEWDQLPTRRASLAVRFRAIPDDDLRVSGFTVVLRMAGARR